MTRTRLGLLGLCAVVFGVMAFSTGAAQAETGAYWLVKGAKFTTLLPELAGTLEGHGTLLSELVGINFHILCTAIELKETHLLEPDGGLLGFIVFSGCDVYFLEGGKAVLQKECVIPGKTVTTDKTKGLIVLNASKEGVTKFEPAAGATGKFATISMGETCPIGESITVKGSLILKDCQKAFLTDQVTHLVEADNAVSDLLIGLKKATLDGSANVVLGGTHKGLTWSGHPA